MGGITSAGHRHDWALGTAEELLIDIVEFCS